MINKVVRWYKLAKASKQFREFATKSKDLYPQQMVMGAAYILTVCHAATDEEITTLELPNVSVMGGPEKDYRIMVIGLDYESKKKPEG